MADIALQRAVTKDGALLADARSGAADPVSGDPVSAGTLFFAGFAAIARLADVVDAVHPPPPNPEDRSP